MTYGELEARSLGLAAVLLRKGVRPQGIVALMMEQSLDMAAGMLAIMMVGCAYLPLDPDSPLQRRSRILADSAAQWILTQSHLQKEESDGRFDTIPAAPHDAAYIIYTSGSTGMPKGVVVEHRSIVNTIFWNLNYYEITARDVVLQLAPVVFDASVEAIFTPLAAGAQLALVKPEHRLDVEQLRAMLEGIAVTGFSIVPSLYEHYIDGLCRSLRHLRFVTLCGERCSRELVQRHFEVLGNVRLYNGYGPSENSVCSTIYPFDPAAPEVLIGGPIANVSCYVLDKYGFPTALGVAGQLFLAGAGLARGYLNRPELTAQSFGNHSPAVSGPLYKTGDLARWLPDGNLEFLGRIDRQVKIRGFRVELEEIEARLAKHPLVARAAVMVRHIPAPELCAYVTATEDAVIEPSQLQTFLAESLPHYMVPARIATLDEMPLTPSGKIDRQRLPAIEPQEATRQTTFVEPRTELETQVAAIWREVLGVRDVGLRDNFFAVGGNSLKVMELATKLTSSLQRPIQVMDLFKRQTISAFIAHIDSSNLDPQPEDKKERRPMLDRARRRQDIQKNRRRRR